MTMTERELVAALVDTPRSHPLAPIQRQLWLADQFGGGPARYNIAEAYWLEGALDTGALASAVDVVVARHEALRAVIVPRGEGLEQIFAAPKGGVLRYIDLTALPAEAEAEAVAIARDLAREPFDASSGLLLRAVLVAVAADRHVFSLAVHHAAVDGWSLDILRSEISLAYRDLLDGRTPATDAGHPRFGELVEAQARALGTERRESLTRWWRERLADVAERLELPGTTSSAARGSSAGVRTRRLDSATVARVDLLARQSRVTRFIVLLSAWQTLLARWTGEHDVVVGCPVWGRSSTTSERVVGCFINLLPIRVDTAAASFAELMTRVRVATLAACEHGDLPYSDMVAALDGRALLQAAFALHGKATPFAFDGIEVRRIELERGGSKFELMLEIFPEDGGLRLELEHDRAVVDDRTAECVIEGFTELLAGALAEPTAPVASLPALSPAERRRVIETFNDTAVPFPSDACVHDLVREHAERTPDAVAVVQGDTTLTYGELWSRASATAVALQERGVCADDRVVVLMERSVDLIVTLVGILAAGGCYVPLDPRHPHDRLEMMCADAEPRVIVADETTQELAAGLGAPVLLAGTIPAASAFAPAGVGAGHTAYVCYTSGSTGKPKGVKVPHRGVVRLVRGATYVSFEPRHVFLHHSSLAFDASVFEIWGALLNGATLALTRPGKNGLDDLIDAIRRHGVTSAIFTTSLFNLLVDERLSGLASLEQILFGGEACSPDHVARAHAGLPGCRLVNAYGPTECTVMATCADVLAADAARGAIPIGGPIANTTAYVLDGGGQPVPVGVAGELYLGGPGVANGYLARPELTAQRFLPNPFHPGTMYRTGDMVRWLEDGRIEFVGRRDDQVKIRGFRIEPGEIQEHVTAHPQVARAHVGTLPDPRGGKRLVAWVVPAGDCPDVEDTLRRHLASMLPDFMVPSAFVILDRLPLNASGKVDRNALPAPAPIRTVPVRPRDELETTLIGLFEEVLGTGGIGVHDSFFDLGGHSLLATKLAALIEARLGLRVPLTTFFEERTVAELAARLRSGVWTVPEGLVIPLQPRGDRPPIFWVHSLGGDRTGSFMYYRTLARMLGPDQPSFGIRSPDTPCKTIEAMASTYADAIAACYPTGPVLLGGFCFGGVVAYELARALTARGRHVALVVMMESNAPREPGAAASWLDKLVAARQLGLAGTLRRAQRWLTRRRKVEPTTHRVWQLLDRSTYPEECARAAETHWDALQTYRPDSYQGRVVLFRAKQGEIGPHGWDKVPPDRLEIVEFDAEHEAIVRPPVIDELASKIIDLARLAGEEAPR